MRGHLLITGKVPIFPVLKEPSLKGHVLCYEDRFYCIYLHNGMNYMPQWCLYNMCHTEGTSFGSCLFLSGSVETPSVSLRGHLAPVLWLRSTRISSLFKSVAHHREKPARLKISPAHLKISPAHLRISPAHQRISPAHLNILPPLP